MKGFLFLVVLSASALPAFACHEHGAQSATPPLYATQADAEKAAPDFHCTGAHQMGDKWMPCSAHGQVKSTPH